MKIEMKILTQHYNYDEFNKQLELLKKQGWEVEREYGGKMPNFTGHGASLKKIV